MKRRELEDAAVGKGNAMTERRCPKPVFVDDGWPLGECQRRAGRTGLCDVYDGRDDDARKATPWKESDGVLDFNGNKVENV